MILACVSRRESERVCEREGEGEGGRWGVMEISRVFVNADVHIVELLHIFLRESIFKRHFKVYPVI